MVDYNIQTVEIEAHVMELVVAQTERERVHERDSRK